MLEYSWTIQVSKKKNPVALKGSHGKPSLSFFSKQIMDLSQMITKEEKIRPEAHRTISSVLVRHVHCLKSEREMIIAVIT